MAKKFEISFPPWLKIRKIVKVYFTQLDFEINLFDVSTKEGTKQNDGLVPDLHKLGQTISSAN